MAKKSELMEIIAAWQMTNLAVTMEIFEGVHPSMRYPGALGSPLVGGRVKVYDVVVCEFTAPQRKTAENWLHAVSYSMGLKKPVNTGSVCSPYMGPDTWFEKQNQVFLLEKIGADPVAVLRATQYQQAVGWVAIGKMTQHQINSLLQSDLSLEESRWYGSRLGKLAVELAKNSTWETNEEYLYRSRYPEVRKGSVSVASKERAMFALNDPETEVVRTATMRLIELEEKATVDAVALDESRSSYERLTAIANSSRQAATRLVNHQEWEIACCARIRLFSLLGEAEAKKIFAPAAADQIIRQDPKGSYGLKIFTGSGLPTYWNFPNAQDTAQAAVAIKCCGRGVSSVVGNIEITGPRNKKVYISGDTTHPYIDGKEFRGCKHSCPYTHKIHNFFLSDQGLVEWPWWMGTVYSAQHMVEQIVEKLNS